jgi:hypothetical protein
VELLGICKGWLPNAEWIGLRRDRLPVPFPPPGKSAAHDDECEKEWLFAG